MAKSVIALERAGIDRNAIETIFITHGPGDDGGGLPSFVLDAPFLAGRRTPRTIVGHPGSPPGSSR